MVAGNLDTMLLVYPADESLNQTSFQCKFMFHPPVQRDTYNYGYVRYDNSFILQHCSVRYKESIEIISINESDGLLGFSEKLHNYISKPHSCCFGCSLTC